MWTPEAGEPPEPLGVCLPQCAQAPTKLEDVGKAASRGVEDRCRAAAGPGLTELHRQVQPRRMGGREGSQQGRDTVTALQKDKCFLALTSAAQWAGCRPTKRKAAGPFPGQGTRLGCWLGRVRGAIHRCFSHASMSLYLSFSFPSPPLSLKIKKSLKTKKKNASLCIK